MRRQCFTGIEVEGLRVANRDEQKPRLTFAGARSGGPGSGVKAWQFNAGKAERDIGVVGIKTVERVGVWWH
jgi:hypothetical protein